MTPTLEQIRPKVNGKSDFFSWRLFQFMRKHGCRYDKIYASNWNPVLGRMEVDSDPSKAIESGYLMIGHMDSHGWFGGRGLRRLCSGPSNGSLMCMSYSEDHGVSEWVDVTDLFWEKYLKIGVCAIHRNFAHEWSHDGDLRTCIYCQKTEKRIIEMVEKERWVSN